MKEKPLYRQGEITVKEIRETTKRMTASKEEAIKTLQRSGILDKNGNLAAQYRQPK